jgi:predicted aspartyl protease
MGNVRLSDVPIVVGSFRGLFDIRSPSLGAVGFVGRGFLQANSAIIDLTNLRLYLRPPGKGRKVDLGSALRRVGMGEASFAEISHGNYLVNVELNGVPAKMIMDTGAFLSGVDSRFAKQAAAHGWGRRLEGIDANGVRSAADFSSTKSFKVGGYPIRSPIVTVQNFGFYNQSGGKIVGLLGMDVLGQNWGIIDFGQKKLYFAVAK